METVEQAAEAAFWKATRYRAREVALKVLVGLVFIAVWESSQAWSKRQTDDVLGGAAVELAGCRSFVKLADH